MILDFREIPISSREGQLKDEFELFARDVLQTMGFEIVSAPNRGADGKKDLIVREIRKGKANITSDSQVMWLVSCKHYANSAKAVSDSDEPDLVDRLLAHECNGFLGFYSTLPSSGLGNKIDKLKFRFEVQLFDQQRIEKIIVGNPRYLTLFQRYFPNSYKRWKEVDSFLEPIKLFEFFFKKNYSSHEELFRYVFNDTSTLIKSIRSSSSFESMIGSQGYKIFVEPVLNKYERLTFTELGTTESTTMGEIFHLLIPRKFEAVKFEETDGRVILISNLAGPAEWHDEKEEELPGLAIYYLMNGYIFCNQVYRNIFDKLFTKLKGMID